MNIKGVLEQMVWWLFLLLLIAIPLPFGAFDGFYWSLFATISSLLLAGYLLLQFFGFQRDFYYQGLYQARYILLLMIVQLIYVAWQSIATSELWPGVISADLPKPAWLHMPENQSIYPGAALPWLAKSLFTISMFTLALCLINTRRRIKWIVYCLLGSAVLHAFVGILAKYSGLHLVPLETVDGHFDVSRGLFVNRNHYAAMVNYGIAMLMISGVYFWYTKPPLYGFRQYVLAFLDTLLSRKLVWCVLLVLLMMCLNFSTSRAAALGMIGSLGGVMAFAILVDAQLRSAWKWYLLILLLMICVVFIGNSSGLMERLHSGALSIGERSEQWRLSIDIFQQHWLFGSGAGTYAEIFQWHRSYGDLRQVVYDQAHSVYVQTLVEQGIVGFILWIAVFVLIIKQMVSGFIRNNSRYVRSVVLGCLLGICMALLQAMVDFNLLLPALNIYFYCIVAIGFSAISVYKRLPDSSA